MCRSFNKFHIKKNQYHTNPTLTTKDYPRTYVLSYHRIHELNLELCKNCSLPGVVQQLCQRSATGVEPDLGKSLASERRNLRSQLDSESSTTASK
jgi:hypothetical protein